MLCWRRTGQQVIGQIAFAILQGEDFFFHCAFGQQLVHEDGFVLADAIGARRSLFFGTAGFHHGSKWMTVSAAVRLRPVPPALRLMRNSGTSPFWKRLDRCFTIFGLAGQLDVIDATLSQGLFDQANMLVNCENSSTRRPSSISSGNMPMSRPSLADSGDSLPDSSVRVVADALGSLTRRGSQHT